MSNRYEELKACSPQRRRARRDYAEKTAEAQSTQRLRTGAIGHPLESSTGDLLRSNPIACAPSHPDPEGLLSIATVTPLLLPDPGGVSSR